MMPIVRSPFAQSLPPLEMLPWYGPGDDDDDDEVPIGDPPDDDEDADWDDDDDDEDDDEDPLQADFASQYRHGTRIAAQWRAPKGL
jgi:hypothetical protein